jgi:RNA polymerase sigma-70 factor (ECF subfamily)
VDEVKEELGAHVACLRRYAIALLGNRVEADDLVQDCLARALSRLHLWQPGTNLRAWLFTILHNLYVNRVRQHRRIPEHVHLGEGEITVVTPPNQSSRVELGDLAAALDKLPDDQRVVVLLVGLEGMQYQEVADILRIPIGTVMSRLSRGREALRRHMAGRAPVRLRRVK